MKEILEIPLQETPKKVLPPALSVQDQIENLRSNELRINDDKEAAKILNSISYYRLIKAYGVDLKERNSVFDGNVTFIDIYKLYEFNTIFRHLIFEQIERIEVSFRCRLANYLCEKYGVLFYENSDTFENEQYYRKFISEVKDSVRRNKQSPFIKNFQTNYVDGKIPFYALVEVLSYGAISKMYKNLHSTDKKAIAQIYGIGWVYLESWMESIAYIRNICAHYGRLYNIRLDKTPKLSNTARENDVSNNRIFGALFCMSEILPKDIVWINFVDRIDALLMDYAQVDKNKLGFPDNWQELLKKV